MGFYEGSSQIAGPRASYFEIPPGQTCSQETWLSTPGYSTADQHPLRTLQETINISEMCGSTQPPDKVLCPSQTTYTGRVITMTKKAGGSAFTGSNVTEEVEWSTWKLLLGCLTGQAHQGQAVS